MLHRVVLMIGRKYMSVNVRYRKSMVISFDMKPKEIIQYNYLYMISYSSNITDERDMYTF